MVYWVNSFIDNYVVSYGVLAILVLMTFESALIPIPSELVMTLAGFLAATGKLNLLDAILAGVVGNVVGSMLLWVIGRTGGRALAERYGRYVRLRAKDLDRAEKWFNKHGEAAVIISRLLPVVRSVISLPAGVAEMPFGKFTLYTFVGSVPFVALLGLAGYWLGSNYSVLVSAIQYLGYALAIAIVAVIVAFFVRRGRSRSNLGTLE